LAPVAVFEVVSLVCAFRFSIFTGFDPPTRLALSFACKGDFVRCFHVSLVALIIFATSGCDSNEIPDHIPPVVSGDKQATAEPMNADTSDDNWQKTWDARLAVLEAELGKSDDKIATSLVPIYLGGGADVLTFKNHVDGVAYVTAGLIGGGSQQQSELGEYELLMCFREESEWAPSLLSRLAPYTFETALKPGETMDIAPAMPKDSTIAALLFVAYRQFIVNETKARVLLCIGITESELAECQTNGPNAVLARLKDSGVFPFTDMRRRSVIQ
jgi:Suppressor of fused protein (SUFU)